MGVLARSRRGRALKPTPQDNFGYLFNWKSLTVVIPLLPGTKNVAYVVNVKATHTNGLDQDRYLDVGQIRGLDNSRVLDLVGVLEEEYWELIRTCLNIVLDF